MVVGVGCDILHMQRIRDILEGESASFVSKVYTEREREQAAESSDDASYFATRFAGKEAVFKCFGICGNVRLNEIEILDGPVGQPLVSLSGEFREIAARKGVKNVQISLSFDTDYVLAFAVAET